MTIAPAQLEQHRTALTGHCYRMMGSAVDADDAVQETIVRAWRSLDRFDGRASLRTWLYRIATNVLGWSAAEVAETLETSVAAVNSALQRARATLASRDVSEGGGGPLSEAQSHLLNRYVEAFHRYDVEALTALLREDAVFSMPPYALWFRGRAPVRSWLLGRGAACRGSRLVPAAACGSPAFGQYKPDGSLGVFRPWALVVLELSGEQIA